MGQKLEKELERARRYSRRYSQHGAKVDSNTYATMVFNTFDSDDNGCISFEEFVKGLSTIWRGSPAEKLEWVFDLYDTNQKGYITKPDLFRVVKSIYELMGRNSEPPISSVDVMEHVQDVFTRMDANDDGKITLQEFLDLCKKDSAICQSLQLFNTVWIQV